MFAVIYQGYLKPGRENEYQGTWNKVAQYFRRTNLSSRLKEEEINSFINNFRNTLESKRRYISVNNKIIY